MRYHRCYEDANGEWVADTSKLYEDPTADQIDATDKRLAELEAVLKRARSITAAAAQRLPSDVMFVRAALLDLVDEIDRLLAERAPAPTATAHGGERTHG